jgi:hypothetical protein
MRFRRHFQLAVVAALTACGGSTGPGASPTSTLAVPTAGGTLTLPSAGGFSASLQIGPGAPAGVTITATASMTAPAATAPPPGSAFIPHAHVQARHR